MMRRVFTIGACLLWAASGAGCGARTGASPPPVQSSGPITVETTESPRCAVPYAPASDELEAGLRAAERGDVEQARRLLARACDGDNPCACTELGRSYVVPPDGARDVERGIRLLQRACDRGDAQGCYALGSALFRFHPERVDHARDLFEDACTDGVPEACFEMGRLRMSGIDGHRSALGALQFYDRACRGGVAEACAMLGEAYAAGVGTRRDPRRAAALLARACEESGVARACRSHATLLDVDDEARRNDLLRRACDGGDPTACDALDPEAERRGVAEAPSALSASVPAPHPVHNGNVELETTIGGDVDLGALGLRPACVGFVAARPSAVLRVPEGATELTIGVGAAADAVLAVRAPDGRWICRGEGLAGDYTPVVRIESPAQGDHLVWAGTIDRERSVPARLEVRATAPTVAVPEPSYDDLPPPTPEAVTMPEERLRLYRLEVVAMPGLTGRVRVDGREVWSFANRGGRATLEEIQCALTPGTHTIDVEILRRGREARLIGRASSLVALELRGALRRRDLAEETSRIHLLEWSPDEPGRRQLVLEIGPRQGGDRSSCP